MKMKIAKTQRQMKNTKTFRLTSTPYTAMRIILSVKTRGYKIG
jgi:hypothetical protein